VVIVYLILAIVMAIPLLVVAVALGPVLLGILCAVGFGLIVFVLANLVIGLFVGAEKAGSRLTHHS
jgi:hypothetical protein